MRKLVRPRACGIGGDVVSLAANGITRGRAQLRAQQTIAFTVWGKRAAQSSQPQPF